MINLYVSDGDDFNYAAAEIKREPGGREMTNAVVAVDNSSRRSFGVIDTDGNVVPGTGADGRKAPHKKSYRDVEYYDDVAIFCGPDRFFHFGHFLVEGMERAWPLLSAKYRNAKLVFVTPSRDRIPEYAAEFLRLLGVGAERVILLNKSARFRTLYVPQRAARIGKYTSVAQSRVYKIIAKNAGASKFGEKIYVSRRRMGARSIFGEEKIQRIFEKNGFQVVYPETLGIAEQAAMAAGAKYIAGIAGSALHLCVFMKPGGHLIQLNRARHRDNAFIQYVLCCCAGVDMTLISTSVDTVKKARHGASHPHIVGVTPELKRFFDDNKFDYGVADITPDAAQFAQYKAAVHSYYRRRGAMFKLKKTVVNIIAGFVPGYKNRHDVRKWLGEKLHMDK